MRISDWSSDIASALLISLISDGFKYAGEKHGPTSTTHYGNGAVVEEPFESNTASTMQRLADRAIERSANRPATVTINPGTVLHVYELGRAACRESVGQYVSSSVDAEPS